MSSFIGLRSLQFQIGGAFTLMQGLLTFVCLLNHADGQLTAAVADRDDLSSQRVLEILRENAASLAPISLIYTQEYIPVGDPTETLVQLNIRRDDPREFFFLSEQTLMWSEGRVYISQVRSRVDNGVFSTYLREDSLADGVHYAGSRFVPAPVLFKERALQEVRRAPSATVFDLAYFRTCGYVPLIWSEQWIDSPQLRSSIPQMLDSGGTLKEIHLEQSGENSGLLRIDISGPNPAPNRADAIDIDEAKRQLAMSRETPQRQKELIKELEERKSAPSTRNDTFWLDPERHLAISASEERDNEGQLLVDRKCAEFERIPDRDVWIPRLCTVRHFSFETVPERIFQAPIVVEEFRVNSIDPSPIEAGRFVLDYTETGARINDATDPTVANEPGGYRRTVNGAGENELLPVVDDNQPTSTFWLWFVGLNIIGIVVLICLFGWKSVKRT